MSSEPGDQIVCWDCRRPVAKGANECPICYAGIDPAVRGLTEEAALAEQASLKQLPPPQPSEPLGCPVVAAYIALGIFAAVIATTAVGSGVDSQPCRDDLCEGYGGIFAGVAVSLIGVPAFMGRLVSLARRSRIETSER